ncbi:hypothetical protein ASAP_0951 [Asaia bogorensis]|uniref:Uncharacterized protein n=1 Tax=Asaia bogorensis TaxID=91915 RepID=A0A060QIC8_9PROT|nr:hypothetical protein ASAP_0951 [Asaia bogorensis]
MYSSEHDQHSGALHDSEGVSDIHVPLHIVARKGERLPPFK